MSVIGSLLAACAISMSDGTLVMGPFRWLDILDSQVFWREGRRYYVKIAVPVQRYRVGCRARRERCRDRFVLTC
jgi:hypothetical protein